MVVCSAIIDYLKTKYVLERPFDNVFLVIAQREHDVGRVEYEAVVIFNDIGVVVCVKLPSAGVMIRYVDPDFFNLLNLAISKCKKR